MRAVPRVNRVLNSDDGKSSRGPRYAKRMQMNCAELPPSVSTRERKRKERERETRERERDREIVYQILEYLYPRMEVPTFSIGSSSSRGTCTKLPCPNTVRRLISHQPALVSVPRPDSGSFEYCVTTLSREINLRWMEFVIFGVSLGTDYE